MNKNTVLIGKESKRIILHDEETTEFPKLDTIYEMITNSDISRLFMDEKHFINYLKEIVDGGYSIDDKRLAFESIYNYIEDLTVDYDNDIIMYNLFDNAEEFSEMLLTNFNSLYEVSYPETSKKTKKSNK